MGERTDNTTGRVVQLPEGEVILREGEINVNMYKILTGFAEIYVSYDEPEETVIGIIGPGECFGEFGLLLHKPAIYTVVSFSDISLFRISEEELGDFVRHNHSNAIDIMKNMANYMVIMRLQIELLVKELEAASPDNEKVKMIKEATEHPSYSWDDIWEE